MADSILDDATNPIDGDIGLVLLRFHTEVYHDGLLCGDGREAHDEESGIALGCHASASCDHVEKVADEVSIIGG